MRIPSLTTILLIVSAAAGRAAEPVDNEFFERKVRPILVANCVSCHGEKKQKGGLRLDAKAGFAKGGENGPAVVPGKPDQSRLVKAVRYDDDIKMPPKGKLDDADIATLTAWVKGGAPWPDDGAIAKSPDKRSTCTRGPRRTGRFSPIAAPASSR